MISLNRSNAKTLTTSHPCKMIHSKVTSLESTILHNSHIKPVTQMWRVPYHFFTLIPVHLPTFIECVLYYVKFDIIACRYLLYQASHFK